ncbi:MAG: type II secretion system protein [Candidatus Aegiribacteria sp.]|nr:type II secretion system protein [Candidatus Aegiribacteria sp.]
MKGTVRKHRGGGFTLVEVVITSLILAILLTGIGFFFTNIIKQSSIVDDRTKAMELARQGLEEMGTLDITAMALGLTTPDTLGIFRRCFDISEYDVLYPNARLVQCIVSWTGASGSESFSLSTIF